MKINIEYVAQVKEAAGKAAETILVDEGAFLIDVFKKISSDKSVAFRNLVFTESLKPVPSILITVNDEQIDDVSSYVLQNNDRITILSPMSGG
ncbi:MAG: MoaD/ThiS family protein [Fibrobacteres bacterium]|nr:MoaD/ThiS family protein [Fibrobacterota bacterium]